MTKARWGGCRSCGEGVLETILDLGPQPDPDWLLDRDDSASAPEAPVVLAICGVCGLVQMSGPRPDGPPPLHGHASSTPSGDAWATVIRQAMRSSSPAVWDIDQSSGLPVDALAAGAPAAVGSASGGGETADLILAGHALAHTDDLDGLVERIAATLVPGGVVSIDFHHVLGVIQGQFDVISHTHRSYLSLCSLDRVLERHGLRVVAARCVDDFGGTVRVLATSAHYGASVANDGLEADEIRRVERTARVDEAAGYAGLADRARVACAELIEFLGEARRSGHTVLGYGASSRGTVLLNLADVDAELLPFVVDRSEAKQGRRLPGSQVPIRPVAELERERPDYVMILPWPSASQIIGDLRGGLGANTGYVTALPRLELL